MKEDLRDERLGGLLETAVRGIEPRPEERLPAVFRKGARRRAARWTAIVTALAVFVGGIGWAAFQVRGGRAHVTSLDTSTWNDYRDPSGWSALYPDGWHLQTFSGNWCMVSLDGAFFSNVAYDFRHPDLGPNECTDAWDLSRLPDDAVAVDFHRFSGGPAVPPGPDSVFPLALEAAEPVTASPGPPAGEYLFLPVAHGGQRYELYVWLGLRASQQDREAASLIVSSIAFNSSPSPAPASQNEPQEIAHGEEAGRLWTLGVWPHDTGWCLSFSYAGEGPRGGCGTDLGDRVFGGAGSSGGLSWSAHTGLSTAPRDLEGYVTTRAASVEYQLVGGRTIAASVYPLPTDAFGGGAQAYILFVPNDALIQAGDLVAYDAQGTELGRQYLDFSPVTLYPAILKASSPEAVDAMRTLQLAGAVAARYFYDHASWDGFDPASAAQISDALTYNTSSTAVVGEVSLRVAGKDSLVLATKISNGDVYSACFQSGPSRVTHGRNDASDPSACSNGWLNSP